MSATPSVRRCPFGGATHDRAGPRATHMVKVARHVASIHAWAPIRLGCGAPARFGPVPSRPPSAPGRPYPQQWTAAELISSRLDAGVGRGSDDGGMNGGNAAMA